MTQEETQYYNNLKDNPSTNQYVFDKLFTFINGITMPKQGVTLQLINGIPMVTNAFTNVDVFGQLFPQGISAPSFDSATFQNIFNTNQEQFISPFIKKYLRADGIPVKLPESTSIFDHSDGYEVNVVSFNRGSNMLDFHDTNNPKNNELWILYEKDNSQKSNLFGSFVLAKAGKGYLQLLNKLKNKTTSVYSHINNSNSGIILNSFESDIQDNYNYLLTKTVNISKDNLRFAIETEMKIDSNAGKVFKSLFGGLDDIITDITEGINDSIENVKFTDKEYIPQKKEINSSLGDYLEKAIDINQILLGIMADYAIPDEIEQYLSKSFDEFIASVTKFAKDNLPKGILTFLEKAYNVLQEILIFYKEAATFFASLVGDSLYLIKAFVMGFVNGLLSTIQTIVSLIGWLLKSNADKKLTGRYYQELQSNLEFIEDLIDLVSETTSSFYEAIRNLFTDFSIEKFNDLLTAFKGKASQINRFEVAYFCGSFIFEIVLGVLLAIFTGGASAIAEAANAAEKASVLFKLFLKEAFSTATMGIVDILQLFKSLIANFVLACKNGWKGLKEFLEKLMTSKADDIVDDFKNDEKLLELLKKLQKGAGDINKSFAENAGIKFEKWLTELKIVGQTTDYTCAATSLKMVLEDKGIIKLEDELARALKTNTDGASILDIPEALYFKRLEDQIKAIAERKITLESLIEKLDEGDKAIVSVYKKDFGFHAVVLEKVVNGKVFLRDPLPINKGASYSMEIKEFKKIFYKKGVIIKK